MLPAAPPRTAWDCLVPVLIRMGWNGFKVMFPCFLLSPPRPLSFLVRFAKHIWKASHRPPPPPQIAGV